MSYSRIPAELRSLKQWVLWDKDKIPYQINGRKADVSNPDTWNSFSECELYIRSYCGVGFVFSNNDDYTGIDLDYNHDPAIVATQLKIFNEFDSYSEISPSGKGLHIIVKGTVSIGRRKNSVEVYSSNRFFTMTGNVYHDKPIEERQALLTQLWEQMGPAQSTVPTQYEGDQNEKYTDKEIIEQAKSAINGEKFNNLFSGHWRDIYPSQSEADYAFIDIIAYYTKNRSQIIRLFKSSALGKRPKANRQDYVKWMIDKSFDQTLPPLDFSGFKEALERKLENGNDSNGKSETSIRSSSSGETNSGLSHSSINGSSYNNLYHSSISIPPGLIGQIARFIYSAAPKPVPEIAIAGAFGLMAGICGRAYNVSSTGLNQYILLLAPTGCHAAGTKILMHDGTLKNVEDIQIGELLMGPMGFAREVLSLAWGKEQMVKIIPTKGEEFIVNINHILSLIHTVTGKRINIKVKDWLMQNKTFKHCHKLERSVVLFDTIKTLPIDPWFLGAMLGDGQFCGSAALTSQDEEIRVRAASIILKMGLRVVTQQVKGNAAYQDRYVNKRFESNQLQIKLKLLRLWGKRANDKFIPHIYKTGSAFDRMSILAGLLDTDGSLTCNGYDYISKSEQLAKDVVYICRSLGYAAYLKECFKYSQNGSGGKYYRVSISGDLSELPMSLQYKKAQPRKQKKNVRVTGFKVELLGNDNYYGFTLDKDHLYLTGDFVVHHNTGKEAMSTGIDRLMSSVKKSVITAGEFVGPSEIASGQALVRYMDKTSKCFVSLFDEFGHRLQAMANPKAHNAELVLQRKLLEVYQKSGRGQEWQPSVYADSEKNTKIIPCPAMSILGYCTPEKLYAELNEEMITDGLLPRFSIIEYNGSRPETNHNHAYVQPSPELTNQLADLCGNCLSLMHGNPQRWIDISFDQESWNLSNAFDKQCDAEINKTNKEIYRRLWTRAHLKALKLAGLIAVGCNYLVPTITVEHLQYAIDMVTHDIIALTAKFESGETGKNTDEIKQHNELLRTATEFFTQDWEKIAPYCPSSYALYKMKLIPKEYFNSRTKKLAAFKNDKRGATVALDRAIKSLIDDGKLVDYTKHINYKLLATTKVVYAPTPDLIT